MTLKTSNLRRLSAFLYGAFFLVIIPHTYLHAQIPNAWINEIHYDNTGTDVMEGVEIVVENTTDYDISSFVVILYNGSNGQPYGTFSLSQAEEGETVNGFTLYTIDANLQNELEGIALSYQNELLQFLSYEGTMTASEGIAQGITSEDIGVMENNSSTPVGHSLQLSGIGNRYRTFTWEEAAPHTFGAPNHHQLLRPINGPEPVTALKVEKIAPDKVEVSWTKPIGVHGEDWDGVLLFASKAGPNLVDLQNKDFTSFGGGSNVYGDGTPTENGYTVARRETNTHGMVTITGLEAGETYYFVAYTAKIISGSNDDIFSMPSEEIIVAPTVSNISNLMATPLYERVRLEWENPKGGLDWWKEVMVIASESDISFIPDAVDYSANSQYGEGDDVGLGAYVVYKGKDEKATIQGLENQSNYHFKIFVLYASPTGENHWSSGIAIEATPNDNIKLWTGNAGTNQFSDAGNWEPEDTPQSYHDIVLNNDYVAQPYEVLFDGGAFSLNSLKIIPSSSQSITVELSNGLRLLDEDEALIIADGGTLINRSNLTLTDGNITLTPQGTYVHNTGSGHADILNSIYTPDGCIPGRVIFDVPNGSYTTSLAGRTFQNLVLKATTNNTTYQVSGGSVITILDTLLIDTNAKLAFSESSNSTLNIKGTLIVHGEADFKNRILFDGDHDQHIVSNSSDGLSLRNIQIVKPQGSIFLHTDLNTGADFIFEEGTVQTQAHLLIFDYSTSPNIEIADQAQILGNVKSTLAVGTEETKIETADLIIGAGEDALGTIDVIRRSGEDAVIEKDGYKSIQRNWEVHAQTPLTQPRALTFLWNEGEDEDMDLADLKVWKKTASGEWVALGDFMSGTDRSITVTTDEFTQFTIADAHNPLPIDLLSFTVALKKDHALLQWSTASERNNRGFEIEKSLDGKTFYPIGFVNGNGTYTVLHEYQFEDKDIFISAYYRLKQLDFNGTATFSPIRFLPIIDHDVSIHIAPNPILKGAQLVVYTHDPTDAPIIEHCTLYNSSGLLTYENNRSVNLKQLEEELNVIFSDLPKGLYILQLVSTVGYQKIKLWKE